MLLGKSPEKNCGKHFYLKFKYDILHFWESVCVNEELPFSGVAVAI
jgi:hypothetical protein